MPQIFPFCAVTRSMTRRVSTPEDPEPQTSTQGNEVNDLDISPLFAEPPSAGACLSTCELRQVAWCQRHPPFLHHHKPPCAHMVGDKELMYTRPTLRASRVNIHSRSQRMRTTGVNQLYSKRWQLHDGDTYSYQPQYFNLDESGSEIRVAADFSVNNTGNFIYFWNDKIINIIVEESNRYFHFIQGGKDLTPHSRNPQRYDVDVNEMKVFLSLVMLMGVIKKKNY